MNMKPMVIPPAVDEHEDKLQPRNMSLIPRELVALHGNTALHSINDLSVALGTFRNTVIPIHRLPNELLFEIFSRVVELTVPRSCWIWVTHVCYLWRDISLRCPNLWTSIYTHSLLGLRAHLRRSKNAPLHLKSDFCRVPARFVPAFTKLILSHVERFASLRSTLEPHHLVEIMKHSMPIVPLLRTLEMRLVRANPRYATIMKIAVPNWAPRLQKVALHGVLISYDSAIFTNLVSFELTMLPLEHSIEMHHLLDVLEASPCMERLVLKWCGPQVPPNVDVLSLSPRVVAVPRLRELTIHRDDPPFGTTWILSHLSIPPSTVVDLACRFPLSAPSTAAWAAIPAAPTLVAGLFELRSLEMTVHPGGTAIEVAGSAHSGVRTFTLYFIFLGLVPNTGLDARSEGILALLKACAEAAPVQSLRLRCDSAPEWAPLLAAFSHLHVLRLETTREYGSARELLKSLGAPGAELPCPRLRRVDIACTIFTDHIASALQACLIRRAARGARLECVRVECMRCRAWSDGREIPYKALAVDAFELALSDE